MTTQAKRNEANKKKNKCIWIAIVIMILILGIQILSQRGDLRKMFTVENATKAVTDATNTASESISKTFDIT